MMSGALFPLRISFRAIAFSGLTAGVCDITGAFIQFGLRGASPIRILHSVASGLIGVDALYGGVHTAVLGLVCHFIVATNAAAAYHIVSRRMPVLICRPFLSGILYGPIVWFIMNFVVIPLSNFPRKLTYAPIDVLPGLLVHVLCVGLPIALVNRRFSRELPVQDALLTVVPSGEPFVTN